MNDNVSPKQLKDLRNEFEIYLRKRNPYWSNITIKTVNSDAFFALNNPIGVDFWSIFANEESLISTRDKIEKFLTNNNRSGNSYLRANGYLSALRHLKAFLDLKHPEYITPYKEKSMINNQLTCLTQTQRNLSLNKDFFKLGSNETHYDINAPQNSDNQTELHIAALNGNADVTIRLIEAGADVNAQDVRGWTPIDIAVDKGHSDVVSALIKAGADINTVDDKERTLLHYAASKGHRDTAIALIEAGIDVNAQDIWGWTPLDNAVDKGHSEVAMALIMADADISAIDDDGWTLLHNAAAKGYSTIVSALIRARVDINAKDKKGKTPLHIAAQEGHTDTTMTLIKTGAAVNEQDVRGWAPLDIAVNKGHTDIVFALIKAGADIKTKDDKKSTLLHYAASKGHASTVSALIEARVDINAKDKEGKTPLHIAAQEGRTDATIALIKAGAALNERDVRGWAPLDIAVVKGHTDIVIALIKAGADINTKDDKKNTLLHYAASKGHTCTVSALIEARVDINAKNKEGKTPFHIAALNGHTDVTKVLIKSGADLNAKDNEGWTLLHYATKKNNLEIAWAFIETEANLDAKDNNGQTPLHFAAQNGHTESATMLINSGAELDLKDNKNRTPYDLAVLKGYKKLAESLAKVDSTVNVSVNDYQMQQNPIANETHEVNTKTSRAIKRNIVQPKVYFGGTTLHSAAYHGHIITVISLIDVGTDVNAEDDIGRTAICRAAEKGYCYIVKVLIQAGANVNIKDDDGQTPMHLASISGHRSTLVTIIEADADVNVKDNYGWTPLHYASRNGDTDTVLTLIEAGADLSSKDNSGWTPLDYASNNGYTETAMALLKADANVNIKNKYCWELLKYAASKGHTDTVINLLESNDFANINYDDGLNFYDDFNEDDNDKNDKDVDTNFTEEGIEANNEDEVDRLLSEIFPDRKIEANTENYEDRSALDKPPTSSNIKHKLDDQIENSSFMAELINILHEYFPNGIRPNSVIDLNKLKRYFAEATGKAISKSYLDIQSMLKNLGVSYGDKIYVITPSAKQKLAQLFDSILSMNNNLFFYDEIYDKHSFFLQEIHIFSSELLKTLLSEINPSLWYYKNYCLTDPNATLESEILNCYETKIYLSYEQLQEKLPYIPLMSIRQALSRNSDFIWVTTGVYTHISKIDFDKKECCEACAKIEEIIKTDGFASLISIDIQKCIEQNPQLSEASVKNGFFQAYLASRYEKRGNIVSKNGTVLSANVVFEDFCLSRDKLTLDELLEFEKEINGNINNQSIYVAYNNVVRIDKDTFIADNLIKFDVNAIDKAIALFLKGDVIPITAVTSFISFPYIDGYQWNWFLLESYCRRFSKKFKFESLSAGNQNIGAIINQSAGFTSYADALAAAVAVEPIELNIKDVGDFLFEKGYIARRTIFVTDVVTKACLIRERVF